MSDEESAACVFADDFGDVVGEGLHVRGGAAEHDQVDEGSSRAGCVEFPELFEVAGEVGWFDGRPEDFRVERHGLGVSLESAPGAAVAREEIVGLGGAPRASGVGAEWGC